MGAILGILNNKHKTVNYWLNYSKLKLNADKTKVMLLRGLQRV